MTVIICIICIWLACGIISTGMSFAYFQRNYPTIRREEFNVDIERVWPDIIWGTIGLAATIMTFEYKGWLWPWSKRARVEAGLES